MPGEFVIYCDESVRNGKHFSNFYGGALIRSSCIDEVRSELLSKKNELNLFGEVKWQKITENYKDKYISLMDSFFDLVEHDRVKVRIMFTQNMYIPKGLTKEQLEQQYFLLYYQFLKHSFGLQFSGDGTETINTRIYFDKLPDTAEKVAKFKGFICGLSSNTQIRSAGVVVKPENVTEVSSHDHNVMQCLDTVLGAMQFRLNDLHLQKPPGSTRRSKRTRAKEKVYKHISSRVRQIYPNFNIGITTGIQGDVSNRWHHPYRHWLLMPSNFDLADKRSKRKK